MTKVEKSIQLGGRKLTLSAGHVAGQATGSVIASYGETVVLATVVAAPLKNDPGYFPLIVGRTRADLFLIYHSFWIFQQKVTSLHSLTVMTDSEGG